MHSISLPNIQDLLNTAVSLIFLPKADIYFFAFIFKDKCRVWGFQTNDCSLRGSIVELSTELLKSNLLLIAQEADYGEHGSTWVD